MSTPPDSPTVEAPAKASYVRYVVGMMMVVMIISSVDRTVLSILVQDIKVDLLIDDREMGLILGPAFTVFHLLASLS